MKENKIILWEDLWNHKNFLASFRRNLRKVIVKLVPIYYKADLIKKVFIQYNVQTNHNKKGLQYVILHTQKKDE